MIFRQITHDDLGCASYLIGDEDAGIAAVVDPRFEVDEYLELARYMGVRIEHVDMAMRAGMEQFMMRPAQA